MVPIIIPLPVREEVTVIELLPVCIPPCVIFSVDVMTVLLRVTMFAEVFLFMVKVLNVSLEDNWGIYPVTAAEATAMARDMKQLVHPKAILIAEDSTGAPIGVAISLPDVNLLLKGLNGRLFPFGWLKLLWGIPRLNQYRMWALGVLPEYHGKAIDSLLYRAMYEGLYNDKLRMEVNYVLEDNTRMNNALLKLGVNPLRRYRVYQMDI